LKLGVELKFFVHTILAALIIATVTELSRRYSLFSALVVSLPITSILALSFIYWETKDLAKVSQLSINIFWLVLPSLGFFLLLPYLLRSGMSFWASISLSSIALAIGYAAYAFSLKRLGVF
jgi:hypothetical protein